MGQEWALILKGFVFFLIWLYLDYRYYKWAGMSPIYGSFKQEDASKKVRDFSFSTSAYIVIWTIIVFLYHKFTNKLVEDFSLKKSIFFFLIMLSLATFFSRLYAAFIIRKEDDGAALLLNGIIFGVIAVIAGIGAYIYYSF